MDKLVVNFAALHQAAGDIQNAINSMESQLHEADSTAAPLVSTWDGEAKAAYQQRQQKWTQAANDLTTLDALQHKLDDVLSKALGTPAGQPVPDLVQLAYEPRTTIAACEPSRLHGDRSTALGSVQPAAR